MKVQERQHPGDGERSSPFAGVSSAIVLAAVALLASMAWRLGGDTFPGGRWPAIHLLTLGVITPLIAAFMTRFADALLHARRAGSRAAGIRSVLLAIGTGLAIAGRLTFDTPLLAVGASLLAAAIGWLYVDLRRARRAALPARFGFIVRAYERACGAFLHGALIGALIGTGVLGGPWYASARAAHLQLMLLGWAGITLLATVVMFAPAVMRTRIEEGADAVAARTLPRAGIATTVAALALLASGVGGPAAVGLRIVACVALAVYTGTVVRIGFIVLRTARRAEPSAPRSFMASAAACFIVASVVNVAAVAGSKPSWTDAAVVVLLTGVFLQAILASVSHVVPLLAGRDARQRAEVSRRMSAMPRVRSGTLTVGVVFAAIGMGSDPSGPLARSGWILVAAVIALTGALAASSIVTRGRSSRTAARPAR